MQHPFLIISSYLGPVHNVRSLRYARSQNGHPAKRDSLFSSCASTSTSSAYHLDSEHSDPDPNIIDRLFKCFYQ